MILRFKNSFSKKRKKVILDNKMDMPRDLYGDTEYTYFNFNG